MKIIFSLLLLAIPITAVAQDGNMQNMNMQNMMIAIQKMQQCLGEIGEEKIKKLENELEKFGTEIETLCQQGKREEAQNKAMKHSKQFMQNPTVKQMEKCRELTKGLVPESNEKDSTFLGDLDPSKNHICDENE